MTTFAAAIDSIRGYLRILEAYPAEHERDIAESHTAIRILEAAGAVDKTKALNLFNVFAGHSASNSIEVLSIVGQIRALLEALPATGTKEENNG